MRDYTVSFDISADTDEDVERFIAEVSTYDNRVIVYSNTLEVK